MKNCKPPYFTWLLVYMLCMTTAYLQAGTTYYVANNGNDKFTGRAENQPFKTINKLNSIQFADGDAILFKSGDVFYGNLKITASNISIGTYGKSTKAVISGEGNFTNKWVKRSDGLWEYTFSTNKPANVKGLFMGTQNLPLSRFPNKNDATYKGYLHIKSAQSKTAFTATNKLDAAWINAEVVVRPERYRLVKTKITDINGSNVKIAVANGVDTLRNGYGFFFVNNIKAIDLNGEWAYNQELGKIFLKSATDPNKAKATYTASNYCLNITDSKNIKISNLEIIRAGAAGISIKNSQNVAASKLLIRQIAGDGILINTSKTINISKSEINNVAWSGIIADRSNSGLIINSNSIKQIGLEEYGKSKTFTGIDCNAEQSKIEYNVVRNTGYAGIISAGRNNLIRRNIVEYACLSLNDNGGIYLNNNINDISGTIVDENFVSNVIGELDGAPSTRNLANGIYIDVKSHNLTITNNTIYNINGNGLFFNYTEGNILASKNVILNCGSSEIYIAGHTKAPQLVLDSNIIINNRKAKSGAHNLVSSEYTKRFSLLDIGTLKNNLFIMDPGNSYNLKISAKNLKKNDFDMSELESLSGGKFAGNKFIKASSIKMIPNSSLASKAVSSGTQKFWGGLQSKLKNSVTLAPYRSLVLYN